MATTGTYTFNPSAGDVVLNAFRLCQVRRVDLTTEHLDDAAYWSQMVAVDFSNRQPNQWQVVDLDVSLANGVATYNLPSQVVAVSAVWLVDDGTNDRIISPMSAVDYASLPNKLQEATPTSYWFDLLSPISTITLWPVPDAVQFGAMRVKVCRQMQDVRLSGGLTLDVPFRFLEAYTLGLAARLAVIYKPEVAATLDAAAKAAFQLAAGLDQERVALNFQPTLSGYFPR